MLDQDRRFILQLDNYMMDELSISECSFLSEHYDDSLFLSYNIPFPHSLKNAVVTRKAEYLAGRICSQKALAILNIKGFNVLSDSNRCSLWPDGIKGSITHSRYNAMAAITQEKSIFSVGIDLEPIVKTEVMLNIKDQISSYHEMKLITSFYPDEIAFTLLFSAKESFFKAAYPSIKKYFNFDTIELIDFSIEKNILAFSMQKDLNDFFKKDNLYYAKFRVKNNYVVTHIIINKSVMLP